jgi:3-isopropylmalate/(R)-2-methylmalate dehydratase small subunit
MSCKQQTIRGRVYVLGDNIDTDQIIPAGYLNLVPTIPEEYARLGAHALEGLPEGNTKFIKNGEQTSEFCLIVAGKNFGCGSSREHAPVALGASGVRAVIAQSYARIFFRNAVATGELYPLETGDRLCDLFETGDEAVVDLGASTFTGVKTGNVYGLQPPGPVAPVIEAGGLFAYARSIGIITTQP